MNLFELVFKKSFWIIVLIVFMALPVQSSAQGQELQALLPEEDSILCTARMQMAFPSLCPETGPSSELAELAHSGILSQRSLPSIPYDLSIDRSLYLYSRLSSSGTPIYGSVSDAARGQNSISRFPPGSIVVSYLECTVRNGNAVYMVEPGAYVRGGSDCKYIALPSFYGFALEDTPDHAYGWSIDTLPVYRKPGETGSQTRRTLYHYEFVNIYDREVAGAYEWLQIGLDEWVRGDRIAEVVPDPVPPEGVSGSKWITVNLEEKTLSAYEDGQMVFSTLVSVGADGAWTRPGLFQIYVKKTLDDMGGSFLADRSDYYFYEDVPWVMYFDEGRALHGVYWHNSFGAPITHGCVNLSPVDARWMYNWAEEGTWVHVVDPSGKVPTDDASYTSYERDRSQ